jgi:hypothetical protein
LGARLSAHACTLVSFDRIGRVEPLYGVESGLGEIIDETRCGEDGERRLLAIEPSLVEGPEASAGQNGARLRLSSVYGLAA